MLLNSFGLVLNYLYYLLNCIAQCWKQIQTGIHFIQCWNQMVNCSDATGKRCTTSLKWCMYMSARTKEKKVVRLAKIEATERWEEGCLKAFIDWKSLFEGSRKSMNGKRRSKCSMFTETMKICRKPYYEALLNVSEVSTSLITARFGEEVGVFSKICQMFIKYLVAYISNLLNITSHYIAHLKTPDTLHYTQTATHRYAPQMLTHSVTLRTLHTPLHFWIYTLHSTHHASHS